MYCVFPKVTGYNQRKRRTKVRDLKAERKEIAHFLRRVFSVCGLKFKMDQS